MPYLYLDRSFIGYIAAMADSFDRSHWTSMAMRDVSFAAIGGAVFGAVPAMWELGPVHPNKTAVPFKVSNFVYSMGNCSVSFYYISLYLLVLISFFI